jgi:endoglucanase
MNAFEVHQYLDSDSSGSDAECVSATVGIERIADFTMWARKHGVRGFLGEFGGGATNTCFGDNADAWLGWTWWAAGPWWRPDDLLAACWTGNLFPARTSGQDG